MVRPARYAAADIIDTHLNEGSRFCRRRRVSGLSRRNRQSKSDLALFKSLTIRIKPPILTSYLLIGRGCVHPSFKANNPEAFLALAPSAP